MHKSGLWLGFCVFATAALGVPTNPPFKGLRHRDASPKSTVSGGSPNANNPAKFRQGFLPLLGPAVISALITQIKRKGCLRFLWLGWSEQPSSALCWVNIPISSTHSFTAHSSILTVRTLQECLEPTPESNRTTSPSHTSRAQHIHGIFSPFLCSQWPRDVQHTGQRETTQEHHQCTGDEIRIRNKNTYLQLNTVTDNTLRNHLQQQLNKRGVNTGEGKTSNRQECPQQEIISEQDSGTDPRALYDCIHPYLFHEQAAQESDGISIPGWI